jgi:excinuclease ABC subunit A
MGPGAGEHGGHVIAEGPATKVERNKSSVTGQYLSRKREIPVPGRREEDLGSFWVRGAAQHNLKNIDVEFPVGKFVVVTGVSGSGKSTLVNEIVHKALANKLHRTRTKPGEHESVEGIEAFDKVIDIDQSPIGRTPRSNPATYTKLFDHIRELYSMTPEAKVRGYKPGRFSFNVRGGRCETCKGDGQIKIEMHFLPDVYVPCETCKGARYNRETLEVRFKGKSIADVLEMSVEEALKFFAKIPKLRRRLQTLHDVGLDYIKLGQPATTLSGGEAQRVKLSSELSKVATGKTLYILDEPTTGLHFADIEKLLDVLQRLVDAGNTVLVIEHNLDVIKQADWVIDLGPEGGEAGGEIVATGTPEEVAEVEGSFTGEFLRRVLPKQAVAAA